MTTELQKVEDAFVKILGVDPLYFHPPYGNHNDQVLQVLAQRVYNSMSSSSSPSHLWSNECLSRGLPWSDDTEDAVGESVSYSEGDLRRCDQRLSQPASHTQPFSQPEQYVHTPMPLHRTSASPSTCSSLDNEADLADESSLWPTPAVCDPETHECRVQTRRGYVSSRAPPPRGSGRISVRVRRRTRYLGRYLDLLISSSGGRGGPWTMKGSDNHDPPICEYTPRTRTLVLLLGRCSHDSNDSSNASSYCTTIS